jgi:hypothetical protein
MSGTQNMQMDAWLRAQLEAAGMSATSVEVLESSEETRLRFNSPTPVTMLTARVACAFGHVATAHIAYWQVDGEWELVELA